MGEGLNRTKAKRCDLFPIPPSLNLTFQEVIPMHLATSPILSEGASRMESQLKRNSADRIRGLDANTSAQVSPPSETPSSGSLVKKRRKRRRKSQLDSLKRDENMNTSEDEDMFPIEMSSDEEAEPLDSSRTLPDDIPPFQEDVPKESHSPVMTYPQSASYPNSDREWSPNARRPPPHLAVAAEGGLSSSCPPQSSHFHASESPSVSRPSTPKSDSELVSKSADRTMQKNNLEMLWLWGELPQATKSSPHKMKESSPLNSRKICDKMHFQAIHSESSDAFSDQSPTLARASPVQPLLEQNKPQTEIQFVNEDDVEALGAAAPPLPTIEEPKAPSANTAPVAASKTDSPSRKKDLHTVLKCPFERGSEVCEVASEERCSDPTHKRSRHLGADGVYLDDLTDMDPEVAALYFPKKLRKSSSQTLPLLFFQRGPFRAHETRQRQRSPLRQPVPSGVGCSQLAAGSPAMSFVLLPQWPLGAWLEEGLLQGYYNWTTAAPLLLAMQAFQKPLPKATVESIMRDKMPRKGGRWWFSWRGRNTTIKEESKPEQCLAGKSHSTGEQPSQLGMATRQKILTYSLKASCLPPSFYTSEAKPVPDAETPFLFLPMVPGTAPSHLPPCRRCKASDIKDHCRSRGWGRLGPRLKVSSPPAGTASSEVRLLSQFLSLCFPSYVPSNEACCTD
ncbi:hypothetical protein Celaphus_00005306 [Cervus elaphus hippelaphus]|uniref:Lipin middle domain-containing protein n=1 Tax=Cervus elaphus hippelaphus TaxID=46360 RepID=A0A212CX50_CEREH|nr:hypothetical protein Celaphus_00005306 [Cervus elaphus hippelaphus]